MSNFIVRVNEAGYIVRVAPTTNIVRIAASLPGSASVPAHSHSTDDITSGTLAVARGGTGVTSLPMLTVITAADATAARSVLSAAATNHNHDAGNITSGTLAVGRIPDLAASKITSGTLDAARIPTLGTGDISGLGTAAVKDTGTGDANVILGDDARLDDARTPVAHSADLVTSGTLGVDRIPTITLAKVSDSGTAAAADTGTGSANVILGNDSRLTDARTPVAHSADLVTSGTLAVARGGTGSATAPMVGVITAADAAAARTVLGVGTGTGDMVAANNLSDLTNTGTARTNLGVPATNHNHATGNITSGTFADARIAASNVTQHADQIAVGDLSNVTQSGILATNAVLVWSGSAWVANAIPVAAIPTITLAKISDSGGAAALDVGTSSGTVCAGDDARLSDDRDPNAHSTDKLTSGTLAAARGGTGLTSISTLLNSNTTKSDVGLGNVTNVEAQPVDADLTAIAGLTSAADKGIQFTGSGTAGVYDLTAAGKALLDDADAAAQRTTLGLGTAATVNTGTSAGNLVVLDGSAKLPAVDGSQLTNISGGGGGTDYVSRPLTGTWRYFDDFFSITPDKGPNDGNNQFWLNQGGSGITPQDNNLVGGRGISMQTFSGANRRYAWWGAGILGGHQPADGDELFWESRFYFVDSNATTGMVGLGVADSIATLNANDQIPGHTYSAFDWASITIDLEQTNVLTCIKDTGGGATPGQGGVPGPTDLGGSYPISSYVDTWIRLGIHVKYNAGNSNWDIAFYINGSSVGTGSMTFASCIVPFVGGGTGTHTGNCNQNIDWISYQGKIGSQISGRTTLIDIDDV